MAVKLSRSALIDRNIHSRDCWLCIVATEGADAEPKYFSSMQERGVIHRSRVRLLVLGTSTEGSGGDGSDPAHVIARLVEIQKTNQFNEDDQFWLVLDVDHHSDGRHKENFTQVLQLAKQKHYRVAVSNPCFEVWLLLHFREAEEVCALVERASGVSRGCKQALGQIRAELGESAYLDALYDADALDKAITRAAAIDGDSKAPWPAATGTHVFRLASVLPRS